jgi:hypothetical protein
VDDDTDNRGPQDTPVKYVPVLENVENESVGMVFRFGALDGLVKVRIENLPGGLNALHTMTREGIPELLADQHHALAIFFVRGIVVRLESPVESIENGNQIRDQAFDAAARLIMAVTLDPLAIVFEVSLAADQCLKEIFFFRAEPGDLHGEI